MECKNCQSILNAQQKFCSECGGKVIHYRLTLKHITSEFSAQFLNYDNKFLKTFFHLFTKPEVVIQGYINGVRKKYINVIQYLAISLTLLGLQLFILNKFYPDFFNAVFTDLDSYLRVYPEEQRPQMEKFMTNYYTFINEYQSLIYVIGIPITALVTRLAFLKEKLFNFTEHIVLNTYITAQYVVFSFFTYLIFAIFNLNLNVLVTLSLLLYIFYYGFVFYKTHKLSVAAIILRFMLSIAIICAIFFIIAIIAAVVAIVYVKFFK
ncbi:DUF3667 domain-containing protein [Aquaticitalea lipolytica]|jgi:hypothetical protein|uniref:DUF3667 domain-containing protein n=1 Tax=Aquaticitalea lipolytica TaxID=1247562 RepID=UPI0024B9AD19|nr:DUF3667 domain-containing protein [Aquaticitalea lipolytica]